MLTLTPPQDPSGARGLLQHRRADFATLGREGAEGRAEGDGHRVVTRVLQMTHRRLASPEPPAQ